MLKYYNATTDEHEELTQSLLEEMQDTGLMQHKRNRLIMRITTLHVKQDKELLKRLFDMLGI